MKNRLIFQFKPNLKVKVWNFSNIKIFQLEIYFQTWNRPSDEPVHVREIVIEKPLKKQWSHNLCNCSGSCNDCCRSFCCPVLRWIISHHSLCIVWVIQYESYSMTHTFCKFSLASLAEKIESNLFGKLNRRQNFQCAGMFAYFCCCPELLCFMTLLLREELKGIFYFERLLGCDNFHIGDNFWMLVTEFRYWWHLMVIGARNLC